MAEHPNEALIRKGYEAFADGDLETLRELFADDILWHVGGNARISGDYKGQEEVFELTGGTMKLEEHDVLANDDDVVALVRGTAERDAKTFDQNEVHVMHVADGEVTEFWGFEEDQAAAAEFWA